MDILIKCAPSGASLQVAGNAEVQEEEDTMSLRRTRNAGNASIKVQLGREMRQSTLALFIQQFEKEGLVVSVVSHTPAASTFVLKNAQSTVLFHFVFSAQEHMNELEARMENMLSTVDKVFKVELMKMPPSLQTALIGDLISGEAFFCLLT